MIPLKDDNPTQSFPLVTVALIVVNVAVHFLLLPVNPSVHASVIKEFGFTPAKFFAGSGYHFDVSPVVTLFSSMFLHGGIMHLGGNMLYLWIFGNNIEDIMGRFRFIIFYLLCGIGGALLQGFLKPDSLIPMIGASGAISGVLGAYLIRFPKARVTVLIFLFYFINLIKVPASIVLGFWIVFQVLSGMGSLGQQGGGVAFFAHIGGFATGILLIKVFEKRRVRTFGRWSPFAG